MEKANEEDGEDISFGAFGKGNKSQVAIKEEDRGWLHEIKQLLENQDICRLKVICLL